MTERKAARTSSASSTGSRSPRTAKKKPRGFAAMDPDVVKEIGRKGGVAAHLAGTAHEFTRDEARAAGRKGGLAPHENRPKPKKSRKKG